MAYPAGRMLLLLTLCMTACGGETVTLGSKEPAPFRFGPATVVAALDAAFDNDNPTLTADLLELVFTSTASGNRDIWHAVRTSVDAPFGAPEPVTALNTTEFETSPALSSDGLTLWFASERAGGQGGLDAWVSTRAARTADWEPPRNVNGLNSPSNDLPRPLGLHGTVMPMATDRTVSGLYWTYLATQTGDVAAFDAPQIIPALSFPDRASVDGSLTEDGLALLFTSGPLPTGSELFVAQRQTTARAFTDYQPIDTVNSLSDDRDPWLSPDGSVLFFTSNRDGKLNVYSAPRLP